jgi:hypothetical protein
VRRRSAAAVAAAFLLAACSPGAREAQPFAGVWESREFGVYLDVHGGSADIYEFSPVHCARVYGGVVRGIADVLSFDGATLLFSDSGRVIRLTDVGVLPADCAEDYWTDDGGRVLDVVAATMATLYGRTLDASWQERVDAAGAAVAGRVDDASVFAALTGLLDPLDDPGVRLAVDDPAIWDGVWASGSGPFAGRTPYEPPGLTDAALVGDGGIVTGSIGDVGYVGVSRLGAFGADDAGSQIALADALDGVLADSAAVILDLRAASSGRTVEAMEIASRFVPEARVVATQTMGGVPAGDVTVEPVVGGPFPGGVVVLIGPGTAGAAEMLVLALRGLPGVTIVGEPTAGSPTPPLARTLPNGWSLGVPALDLVGSDGTSWMGNPIRPDVTVVTSGEDLAAGGDPGIIAALAVVG